MNKKQFLLITLLFGIWSPLTFTGDSSFCSNTTILEEPGDDRPWITIFVHGIVSLRNHLTLKNIVMFNRDQIAYSSYAHAVELIRKDKYFNQFSPQQEMGLKKVDMNAVEPGASATAFANIYDTVQMWATGKPSNSIYYTYGWSGLLSPRIRTMEAEIFYAQLKKELESYHAQGIYPRIRILGYSHGANISLALANSACIDPLPHDARIDELIVVGLPVISQTDHLVNSPFFKKIWHIYSMMDRVQNLDFSSQDKYWSKRTFDDRPDFIVPNDKLVQIELRVKRVTKNYHHRIFREHRRDLLPCISYRNDTLRTASPGHTELWSFGWSHAGVRPSFPFNPIPMAGFAPWLIYTIDPAITGKIIVDVHPHLEKMFVEDECSTFCQSVPFLTYTQLHELKNMTEQYRPVCLDTYQYDDRICAHLHNAQYQKRAAKKARLDLKTHDYGFLGINFHNLTKSSIDNCCALNPSNSSSNEAVS